MQIIMLKENRSAFAMLEDARHLRVETANKFTLNKSSRTTSGILNTRPSTVSCDVTIKLVWRHNAFRCSWDRSTVKFCASLPFTTENFTFVFFISISAFSLRNKTLFWNLIVFIISIYLWLFIGALFIVWNSFRPKIKKNNIQYMRKCTYYMSHKNIVYFYTTFYAFPKSFTYDVGNLNALKSQNLVK